MRNSPAVIILLKETATAEDIQLLTEEVRKINGTREVKYISQEEALRIYKEQNKNDPVILELVTEDILPASLEVYTYDISSKEYQERVAALAKSKVFVEQVVI